MSEKNELALFNESVNRLIDEDLILVDRNIASVLKCVVNTSALRICLTETLKSMTYNTEFSRAKVSWTNSHGIVECKLKLPADKNRLFTFVVCLLTEFDNGRRNFIDFLREYYFENDTYDSFTRFGNEVLKPFKRAGESILKNVDPESVNTENVSVAEKYFNVEKMYIESDLLHKALSLVESVRETIPTLSFNSDGEKNEVVVMCNGLTNALHLKNPRILQLSWIGFKNTMSRYVEVVVYLAELSQCMISIFS